MKLAVVYYSGTGNTEAMAREIESQAISNGDEVTLFTSSDFNGSEIANFDAFAFGCPAMGSEVLEEGEFQPMWDEIKGGLGNKKVALFGSYGWGDGTWMNNWVDECKSLGVNLVNDGVICLLAPDDEANEKLHELATLLK